MIVLRSLGSAKLLTGEHQNTGRSMATVRSLGSRHMKTPQSKTSAPGGLLRLEKEYLRQPQRPPNLAPTAFMHDAPPRLATCLRILFPPKIRTRMGAFSTRGVSCALTEACRIMWSCSTALTSGNYEP